MIFLRTNKMKKNQKKKKFYRNFRIKAAAAEAAASKDINPDINLGFSHLSFENKVKS